MAAPPLQLRSVSGPPSTTPPRVAAAAARMALTPPHPGGAEPFVPAMSDIVAASRSQNLRLELRTLGPFFRVRGLSLEDDAAAVELGRVEGVIRPWLGGRLLHLDSMRMSRETLRRERSIFGLGLFIGAAAVRHGFDHGCRRAELLAINDTDRFHDKVCRNPRHFAPIDAGSPDGFVGGDDVRLAAAGEILHEDGVQGGGGGGRGASGGPAAHACLGRQGDQDGGGPAGAPAEMGEQIQTSAALLVLPCRPTPAAFPVSVSPLLDLRVTSNCLMICPQEVSTASLILVAWAALPVHFQAIFLRADSYLLMFKRRLYLYQSKCCTSYFYSINLATLIHGEGD